jgi:hypothetical protein
MLLQKLIKIHAFKRFFIPVSHGWCRRNRIRKNHYGSPTLSDQSVLSCKSLKLGPGETLRSHSANEFIFIHEIKKESTVYQNTNWFFQTIKWLELIRYPLQSFIFLKKIKDFHYYQGLWKRFLQIMQVSTWNFKPETKTIWNFGKRNTNR